MNRVMVIDIEIKKIPSAAIKKNISVLVLCDYKLKIISLVNKNCKFYFHCTKEHLEVPST